MGVLGLQVGADPDSPSLSPFFPAAPANAQIVHSGQALRGEGGQHQREDLHHPGGGHTGAAVSG